MKPEKKKAIYTKGSKIYIYIYIYIYIKENVGEKN